MERLTGKTTEQSLRQTLLDYYTIFPFMVNHLHTRLNMSINYVF